jgi:hypothetical protein
MEQLRELLEVLRKKGTARGNFLGLLHVLIGRRITQQDGSVVSAGVTWRELAGLLKRVRWEPEAVQDVGLEPDNLPVRDRQRYWYTAIAHAGVDKPEAAVRGDHLATALRGLGYVVSAAPGNTARDK